MALKVRDIPRTARPRRRPRDEAVPLPATSSEEMDEFYYGHRLAITYDETGKKIFTYEPLSPDDFLDPEEGDHFVQGTLHYDDVEQAMSTFRYLYRNDPAVTVFSDLKMVWGIEGLSQPAPDVAVVPNVQDPDRARRVFDVGVEGTRPRFILEIVSPRYREPDREKKVAIYERAGVEEYVIVDSWLTEEDRQEVFYEVLGYRLQGGRYTAIQPDERGWVYSTVNDVWIGVSEERDRFFVVDARSGERILPDKERAEVAEALAEAAEALAQAEAAARAEAERRARAMETELAQLREELVQIRRKHT